MHGYMKMLMILYARAGANALAFDVIGELAFGSAFNMLDRDAADVVAITKEDGTVIHAPAVKILNERGEFSCSSSLSSVRGRLRE